MSKNFFFTISLIFIGLFLIGCITTNETISNDITTNEPASSETISNKTTNQNLLDNKNINGITLQKTSEIAVIPKGEAFTVKMEEDPDDYGGVGVFIKDREVTLSAYAIGQYEVTQEFFETIMGINPSEWQVGKGHLTKEEFKKKYPNGYGSIIDGGWDPELFPDESIKYFAVERVSWYAAIAFCNKLSLKLGLDLCYSIKRFGKTEIDWETFEYNNIPQLSNKDWDNVVCDLTKNGYRLPTEAEWEFAARGGDPSKPEWKYSYAGSNTKKEKNKFSEEPLTDSGLDEYGWYDFNHQTQDGIGEISYGIIRYAVHETGKRKPNTLGIYDMSGNVSEWCWDWWGFSKSPTTEKITNPMGPTSSAFENTRVTRGGGHRAYASNCSVSRSTAEYPYNLFRNFDLYGFRLARSLVEN